MDFAERTAILCCSYIINVKSMKHPKIEDLKKVKRLLCFMNQNIENEIIIRANDPHEMQTYVD